MPLAAGALRAIGWAAIPKMFEAGLSATAALNKLIGLGFGYRRTDFLGAWRQLTGMKKLSRAYRFIPRKYRLSYGMMAKAEAYQSHEYKYVFDVHGRDVDTGELTTRTMSMGSDTRFAPDEVEDYYAKILTAEQEWYEDQYGFLPDVVELSVCTRLTGKATSVIEADAEMKRWYGLE